MRRKIKLIASVVLTLTVLAGTVLSGCAKGTDYTEEIRQYQERLESLAAENETLKEQLAMLTDPQTETGTQTETEVQETEAQGQAAEINMETQETVPETAQTQSPPETETEQNTDEVTKILVFGDSIWGNYRDDTGIAARVTRYMRYFGREVEIYNAAVGGTRATLDLDDSQWTYGPGNDASLQVMLSILDEKSDVELLEGKAAYEVMKTAIAIKNEIDVVILAYGLNDFLAQVPINNSDVPRTGFGTALYYGVGELERICPQAKVMIIAPTYASYFTIPVQNMGEKALYNYASVACDVAKAKGTLCMDAYNQLGIDMYDADEYIEDGIHLNEKGRDLYAQHVASCLEFGMPGQISGNAYDFSK